MGKIVAIANQKGGVGKTTTAINLAACLGRAGKRILLADVDPQGNATSGLGINRSEVGIGIYECIIGEAPLHEAIVKLPWEGMELIPATRNLIGAEMELIAMEQREYRLTYCLRGCKELYDFVLIDCPPSLGLLTVNALAAADSLLMPIQCEYYALEGLGQLLETYNLVRQRLNPMLEIEGIILTMADARTLLSRQVLQDVREHFGKRVFSTVIPRNVRLGEAPGFGKPIVEYDAYSTGAMSYLALAREFLERNRDGKAALTLEQAFDNFAGTVRQGKEKVENGEEGTGERVRGTHT